MSLQSFVDRGILPGAITLAATKDRVLSLDAVGWADIAAKKPMTTDSLVWIASMTKPMTATAMMMLVDEGQVNLDDPVEKFLPEFEGQMVIAEQDENHVLLKKPHHPITVREILCHTSGLRFATLIEKPYFDRLSLQDSVRSHAMLPLQTEPGTKFDYANGGTNTAGRIIEVVSGMPYETFMDQRIFGPLGMTDTTFWPSGQRLARVAKVYRTNAAKTGLEESTVNQLTYPLDDRRRQPMPAGGLFSSAVDSMKFCRLILNGGIHEGRRLLSEPSIREMTRKQTALAIEASYGLCWDVKDGKAGHNGAYKTNMTIDFTRGLITVYLLQHDGEWHDKEGEKIHPTFLAAAEKML